MYIHTHIYISIYLHIRIHMYTYMLYNYIRIARVVVKLVNFNQPTVHSHVALLCRFPDGSNDCKGHHLDNRTPNIKDFKSQSTPMDYGWEQFPCNMLGQRISSLTSGNLTVSYNCVFLLPG